MAKIITLEEYEKNNKANGKASKISLIFNGVLSFLLIALLIIFFVVVQAKNQKIGELEQDADHYFKLWLNS